MRKSLKKLSLRKDYFVLAAIVILAITSVSLLYSWNMYTRQKESKIYDLRKTTSRIEAKIREPFDYTEYLMKFTGQQIIQKGHKNLSIITEILRAPLLINSNDKSNFFLEKLDWSTKNKKTIFSTSYGLLKTPIDIGYRNYAKKADSEPWVLHFDSEDVRVNNGKSIIPAGMGITDEKGKMVGILSAGFDIKRLTDNIEAAIDKEKVSFVVLDENYRICIHSTDKNHEKIDKDHFKELLQGMLDQSGYGTFRNNIEYNGVVYSSYLKISGYPYTILAGYNKAASAQEFKETVLPGIIGYSVIGIISIVLLLTIRKLIVVPIIRLSAVADKISKGEEVKRIRGGRTYEINNLALQLIKVKNSLLREQKIQEKQKELLKIIRESDNEKEMFLRELYHAMNNPLNIVIAGAELLKTKQFGSNLDNYSAYLDMIYNAGRQLESYTTDIINPSQMDVKEVIERCVTLQKKKATEIRLNIEVDVPNNIPPIMADELRMRQVIISILGQALFCIQDFGTIKVSAQVKRTKSGKPSSLIIIIEDDGLGISEQQRTEQWEKAFGNPDKIHAYSRNPDITRMSFPIIRHLIKLHHGTFELKTTAGVGSTFIITLPYLSKAELETAVNNITQVSNKKSNLDMKLSANIITFPGS